MRSILVLLAEDEPVIKLDVRYQLESCGFQVIEVDEPAELPALCLKYRPELLMLNFHYKHSADGMSLIRKLHAPSKPKVLVITGARPEDLAHSSDFDDSVTVLHKPFLRRQLRDCLTRIQAQILAKGFPDDFAGFTGPFLLFPDNV